MKIAVISDVHANLPALEATMDDINKRKADKIICLGDLIGKGPSSKQTIDICKNNCYIVIQGNWDDGIFSANEEIKQNMKSDFTERNRWYIADAGQENVAYLGSLPHSAEMMLSNKLIRFFHAHPINFNRYFEHSPIEQRLELFGFNENSCIKQKSDVAIYADIHTAYMQSIDKRILLNVGSVGNPLDITQASYVMLEGSEVKKDSPLNIQFIRVPYDIQKAVKMARESDMPDIEGYVEEITTARYFKRGQ